MKTPEQEEQKLSGIAVAMTPFMAMLSNCGVDIIASQDRVKQEIRNHGLGITTKCKQVFNKAEDGKTISRTKAARETTQFKNCILVKRSVFGPGAWEKFSACKYYTLIVLISYKKNKAISETA